MGLKKYSGTGNSFVLVDQREDAARDAAEEAVILCEQNAVDGVLIMENSDKADIRMRIVNPDGSEADMCGNGSRCAAHWAHHIANLESKHTLETGAGVLHAKVTGDIVKVQLTDPRDLKSLEAFEVPGASGEVYSLNTGVPHVVTELKDIENQPIDDLGKAIRYDELFSPAGTNAAFFEVLGENKIRVRVYERGVEAETKSCGTGTTACALIASLKHGMTSPVSAAVQSGETLNIYFEKTPEGFEQVCLEGDVKVIV